MTKTVRKATVPCVITTPIRSARIAKRRQLLKTPKDAGKKEKNQVVPKKPTKLQKCRSPTRPQLPYTAGASPEKSTDTKMATIEKANNIPVATVTPTPQVTPPVPVATFTPTPTVTPPLPVCSGQ